MNIKFNADETYRDDYTFANSPQTIARAPFPFPDDDYMYSICLLYTSPSPRDRTRSRMPSSA